MVRARQDIATPVPHLLEQKMDLRFGQKSLEFAIQDLTSDIRESYPTLPFPFDIRIIGTDQEPICKTGGKMGRFRIKITQGDRVRAELSPYDLTRGRITYRL